MIVVTGAAGFIGSAMVAYLNENLHQDLILVDDISKKQHINLVGKKFVEFIDREIFLEWLEANPTHCECIFHLGARTNTLEKNIELLDHLNVEYTKSLWKIATKYTIPFIYASSAATYGSGELGYSDDMSTIHLLRPLNPYGLSKHFVVDLIIHQKTTPQKWAGFKFFNVFGPNEYHKGRMASVVYHGFNQIIKNKSIQLFSSNDPAIPHGMQKRDFVYVKDVVKTIYTFFKSQAENRIYNLGSGKAHSFVDLAVGVFAALNLPNQIEFIPMPEELSKTYQNFTEADMRTAKENGLLHSFYSFQDAINEYVQNYLLSRTIY
jgi:ADP-L-glycero-D-manno-heptose 6-epimerase